MIILNQQSLGPILLFKSSFIIKLLIICCIAVLEVAVLFFVSDSADSVSACESDRSERSCRLCASYGDGLFVLSVSAAGSSPLFILISTVFAKEPLLFLSWRWQCLCFPLWCRWGTTAGIVPHFSRWVGRMSEAI